MWSAFTIGLFLLKAITMQEGGCQGGLAELKRQKSNCRDRLRRLKFWIIVLKNKSRAKNLRSV